MSTRTIIVHDRCTTPECNRVLHSISEGERGLCASCWMKKLKPETKKAMHKLLASAFNGSSKEQVTEAAQDAIKRLEQEDKDNGYSPT